MASLVGSRSVLLRVCLSCWVKVGFITCVFVLLGCGGFYHVCVFVVGWRLVLSCVCLSCWVEVGFYHVCVCLVGLR